ncbi:DUF5808 domain-containing protein [Enorma massiliensis]|uniref:DUF5808 domain-containing protein n=2 Tax=Enorma massiliensis TaxID=1472761 RepID=UPI002E776A8F|nr:DUF5808 domain-containing protein [Enorma massiliensis]
MHVPGLDDAHERLHRRVAPGRRYRARRRLDPGLAHGLPEQQRGVLRPVVAAVRAALAGPPARYGHLLRRMTASSALDYDDDELWRLGVFYVNREDSSVVVPRRFGIGWAMNWGNPKSWGLAALLVAAIAAFVVLVEVLFR